MNHSSKATLKISKLFLTSCSLQTVGIVLFISSFLEGKNMQKFTISGTLRISCIQKKSVCA